AGASLSIAAGPHHRRRCPKRRKRHHGTTDRSMALRAAWPAVRHRKQARCGHQYRHRGGRACARRRLPPSVGWWFQPVNATFYDKLNYNFIRDIAPVASIIRTPFVMAVNPTVPAKTVPEFIAYAKTSRGKINYASAGTGTLSWRGRQRCSISGQ